MENDAAKLLADLRQDHRNMARMLNVLEREANRIYEGGDADLELMHDVMHYMTVYPDAVHHPREDRIYGELKSVRPDLTGGFSRITQDHRALAEQGMRLRNDIARMDSGDVVERNTIVRDALRYVNTLRGHMQWEELDLFRRADEMIAEGHPVLTRLEYVRVGDPVFDARIEQRFRRLFAALEDSL